MAMKFKVWRGGESEVVLSGGHEDTAAMSQVYRAWIVSDSELRDNNHTVTTSAPFVMKGGYVGFGGQRRLVIAGKIGRF